MRFVHNLMMFEIKHDLFFSFVMSMTKYWIRLYNDKPIDALLSEALTENITMRDNNQEC